MTEARTEDEEEVARAAAAPTTVPADPTDAADATDPADPAARPGADGAGPGSVPGPEGTPGAGGRARRVGELVDRVTDRPIDDLIAALVTFVVVATCVILTVWVLDPAHVLSDTTPAGGDMGAHVWGPAYLRDHLLTKGRLTGWTMDWYAGFPAYQFYMIVPSLIIAVLSWIVPYGVAFKLVAVSGCVTFPVSCWFFGRSARTPFPVPALLSVGGLLFLFDRSFSIYGGNIASTMAGEFAFSMSLSIGVAYLGVLARGFETGRHRAWAAVLLALTGLCHLLPLIFVLVCTVLYLIVRPGLGQARYVLTVAPVAGALTAFWTVPFYLRSGYMNDMGWERITSDRYVNYLWSREKLDPQLVNSPDLRWVIAFAAVGLMLSIAFRRRTGLFLALVAAMFALGFVLAPQGRLWNARLLPFYYLALYLLAAVGVAELGRLAASLLARDVNRPVRGVVWLTPAVAALAAVVMLLLSLDALPGGTVDASGRFTWGIGSLRVTATDRSFIDSWATWNFEGYEGLSESASGREQYRKSYPEYHDVVQTMADIGRQRGCGRAMWEHEEAHDRYGTPMALMLLPFWTDGCIGSMEGLYFEASATTPYHFLVQDETSWAPSNAQREMPYGAGPPTRADFDRGVHHLQMEGVRYYMAINAQTQALADGNESLTRRATSGPWVVYEVADAPLVEGLANQPAVLTGQPTTGRPWQDVAVCWWVNRTDWDVVLTADGPAGWERVARTNEPEARATPSQKCQPAGWGWFDEQRSPAVTPQEKVTVTNVVTTDDTVSFDVDRPGVPVMVKVSYFPNWTATGAQGPYRAAPNFMVVVPEGRHVELHYGWTGVDLGGIALTLLGLVAVVGMWRFRPVTTAPPWRFWGRVERPDLYPAPEPGAPAVPEPGAGAGPEPGEWADGWMAPPGANGGDFGPPDPHHPSGFAPPAGDDDRSGSGPPAGGDDGSGFAPPAGDDGRPGSAPGVAGAEGPHPSGSPAGDDDPPDRPGPDARAGDDDR
jgi:hypothetical protein